MAEPKPPRATPWRVWRALRTPAPGERPPGVPALRYHIPLRWLLAMGRDMALDRPRVLRADCALAVRMLPRRPAVEGLEHVPCSGPFVVIFNHYQRRDLWIGFCCGLLCDALWGVRDDLRCRLVITDRALLDGATVPLTLAIFARAARVWDLIRVTPPEALDARDDSARLHALRTCMEALRGESGRSTCLIISPEGMHGNSRGLKRASPGAGRSLLALAATGAPLLPAAVFEEPGGALHLRLGPAWHPQPPRDLPKTDLDVWAGDDALRRVAALLPENLRGVYGGGA